MHITKWIILPFMATLAHAADSIDFYAVTKTQKEGSQHVTIGSLGVDGFSTQKPGYTITRVKQAFLLPPGPVTIIDQDGTPKGKRHDTTFNLSVTLPASEQKAFSEFSRQCLGGKILIKIGKEPILALPLFGTIDNGQFELTVDSKEKAERLLKELKKVEQAADGKTTQAPQPPH
jgi:hypothetical protein